MNQSEQAASSVGETFSSAYESLAVEIMELTRDTLLVRLHFLEPAIASLELTANPECDFATDGFYVYYGFRHVLLSYKIQRELVLHDFLHMVLHCLFHHPFISRDVDHDLWDLATDLAVEAILEELDLKETDCKKNASMKAVLHEVKRKVPTMTAEKIYAFLVESRLDGQSIASLRAPLIADDHEIWYMLSETKSSEDASDESRESEPKSDDGDANGGIESRGKDGEEKSSGQDSSGAEQEEKREQKAARPAPTKEELESRWKDISCRVQTDLETNAKKWGDKSSSLIRNLEMVNEEHVDYSDFLRKFAVLGENQKVNDEEFDYIYYSYGMSLYRNIPLVEPLEYREEKRIRDFAVVIDTSASCDGAVVQSFLSKTWDVLSSETSFFKTFCLHIIQCDTEVKEDAEIKNREDLEKYFSTMKLHGFGGTDFRPAFRYIEDLVSRKVFHSLIGILYFTDGYGIFPARKPPFETAFIFLDTYRSDASSARVPSWAMKVIL